MRKTERCRKVESIIGGRRCVFPIIVKRLSINRELYIVFIDLLDISMITYLDRNRQPYAKLTLYLISASKLIDIVNKIGSKTDAYEKPVI